MCRASGQILHDPPRAWGRWCAFSRVRTPRQLDVEDLDVDVAHALDQLRGPGVGQGLGQLPATRLPSTLHEWCRYPDHVHGVEQAALANQAARGVRHRELVVDGAGVPEPGTAPARRPAFSAICVPGRRVGLASRAMRMDYAAPAGLHGSSALTGPPACGGRCPRPASGWYRAPQPGLAVSGTAVQVGVAKGRQDLPRCVAGAPLVKVPGRIVRRTKLRCERPIVLLLELIRR